MVCTLKLSFLFVVYLFIYNIGFPEGQETNERYAYGEQEVSEAQKPLLKVYF